MMSLNSCVLLRLGVRLDGDQTCLIILGEEVALFGRFGMSGGKNSGWFIGCGGDELLEAFGVN